MTAEDRSAPTTPAPAKDDDAQPGTADGAIPLWADRVLRKRRGDAPGTVEVTFELPASVDATEVAIVGEFNDWSPDALRITRDATGGFRTTVVLAAGRRYRFRYLIDGHRWENDWRADDYWQNQFGGDDSVVFTDDV